MRTPATQQVSLAIGVALLAGIAAALAAGAGVAAASPGPDVVGKKYSDAQTALSAAGITPVVSTTVGDRQSWPDCVVDSQVSRTVPPQENSGESATSRMLISLNCDAAVASALSPGNSLASPEGRAAAAAAAAASATTAAKPS
jgi:hypothetical protein